jgi:hypothetical protein
MLGRAEDALDPGEVAELPALAGDDGDGAGGSAATPLLPALATDPADGGAAVTPDAASEVAGCPPAAAVPEGVDGCGACTAVSPRPDGADGVDGDGAFATSPPTLAGGDCVDFGVTAAASSAAIAAAVAPCGGAGAGATATLSPADGAVAGLTPESADGSCDFDRSASISPSSIAVAALATPGASNTSAVHAPSTPTSRRTRFSPTLVASIGLPPLDGSARAGTDPGRRRMAGASGKLRPRP